ncbi:MAG: hypothetical protein K0A98_01925 [Trueperaceae bacterium]|nr:hypothetical protein [Trueperaceae bacterium]
MRRNRWTTLLVLGLLVACERTTPQPPTIEYFVAAPATVRSGAPSTLSWAVTGATALTLEPGIGDVAGLDAFVVGPGTTTTYTLTATNKGGSRSEHTTVTVDDSIDVEGRVLGLDGRPAAEVQVFVHAVGGDRTDASGAFRIEGVHAPFDVTLIYPDQLLTVTYLGLTLMQPTLLLPGLPPGLRRQVAVSGNVSGGTQFPQPAGHRTVVTFGSEATRVSAEADAATGAFAIDPLVWFGPDTAGALHALQWRVDAAGLPVEFTGHGYRALMLRTSDTEHRFQDMYLLPVGGARLNGLVAWPDDYGLVAQTLMIQYPEGGHALLASRLWPSSTFDYATPLIDGTTFAVASLAASEAGETSISVRSGLPAAASSVLATLAPAPRLTAPAEGGTGVGHDTEFKWTGPTDSAYLVAFTGHAGQPTYAVVTQGSRATIPDLSAFGIELPAGAQYGWSVYGLPQYPTVDAAASDDDGFLSSWFFNAFYRAQRDGALTESVARAFVTGP